jgi:hypothetical protein
MEYMAKCMGINVKTDTSKDKKKAPPVRLAALLEQAEKEPEKATQIDLPLHALHNIISFCKDEPNLKQNLKTQSLFEFSLAAAESWETAGLKSARTKLNQKAQKANRKKELEERGDDQVTLLFVCADYIVPPHPPIIPHTIITIPTND